MTTSVIEASALCRVFASEDGREPVRAVDGVTFAVPPEARLVALIGPDGAGKSTLMQMICGLVGQDSGSLSVLGRTPDPDDEDFVNAVGYMPQTLGLYKDLSVMENMKLFGALRGAKPPEDMTIEAYYASLIALTGLEGFEGRPAGKLSGGMKQKLALAVALVRAPALLLLDEPTVGVDPLSRRELWAVIRRMVGQGGTTCFFSTAYLEEAESADWVLCMSEGRIIGSGTPAELLGRTKGRTYALDLSGFSDAERKSLSRRMMLKVSPAPEKSVFLDAVPRDGGIDLLLNAPNTREFAEREVELALRRDETGTVPDFDVLERAPRMEDAYALLTFTIETVRADDAASSAAPDPDDPGRLDTGDVPIRARDLSRTFGSFVAVADTTFDVKRGEIFGLLGPNGAGKTTTFRMLCGLLAPSGGEIEVVGWDLREAKAEVRAEIGYVAQKFSLYDKLTVEQNLRYFGRSYGFWGPRLTRLVAEAMRGYGLSAYRRTPVAQRIAVDFTANPYFDAKVFYAKAPAEKALEAREVECILTIPAGFAANAQQGEAAELGLTVYGVDSNSATLFKSYVLGQLNSSVTKMVSNGMIESAVASRVSAGPVKSLASRSWFNEASISTWYLVPGILVIVVGAASTMMSAIVIAREWERGTMAAIFATPASPLEIFLAKWLSYWTIAFGGSLLSLCTSFLVFGQPLRGSIAGVLAILLTLTAMGTALGLFISAKVKNQFLAIELAVVLAYMPSLMLSGFLFDLRSVPVWIEFVGRLLPPTYAVEAFKQCFLAGDGPILWRNVGILCCWAALFFCMAVRVLRKRPPVTVPDKSEPKGGASC